MDSDVELFTRVASLEVSDARRLLPKLESEGIRFRVEADSSIIRNLTPVAAAYGGTAGTGAHLSLSVRVEDHVKYDELMLKLNPV